MLSPYPADPTLTNDNLMEVVKGVEDRWEKLSIGLDLHQSKIVEIRRLSQSDHHRMETLADHYITHYPTPSWIHVAEALQRVELHKQADEVTTKYVKGMGVNHVMCLILVHAVDGQLSYLILMSNQSVSFDHHSNDVEH